MYPSSIYWCADAQLGPDRVDRPPLAFEVPHTPVRMMTVPLSFAEIVEAEGHLIDSQLMNAMFDTVVRHDAAFDVLEFRIGRTNDEPSFVSMRVTSKTPAALTGVLEELVSLGCRVANAEDARTVPADRDGCAPEDFYSTTNHRTSVRIAGGWVPVDRQRMDAANVPERRGPATQP